MKVIVINDSDGHTNVYKYTEENARTLFIHLEQSDYGQDDNEEKLEDCYIVNTRGGPVHVLEVEEFVPQRNPFH